MSLIATRMTAINAPAAKTEEYRITASVVLCSVIRLRGAEASRESIAQTEIGVNPESLSGLESVQNQNRDFWILPGANSSSSK